MGELAAWNYGSWQSFTGKSQVREEFFQEEVICGGGGREGVGGLGREVDRAECQAEEATYWHTGQPRN